MSWMPSLTVHAGAACACGECLIVNICFVVLRVVKVPNELGTLCTLVLGCDERYYEG
jgi:hypothetical protein